MFNERLHFELYNTYYTNSINFSETYSLSADTYIGELNTINSTILNAGRTWHLKKSSIGDEFDDELGNKLGDKLVMSWMIR